jgi:hypothetical protein
MLSREVPLHTFTVYVRRALSSFSLHGHKIHTNMWHMFWRHFDILVRSGQNTGLCLIVLARQRTSRVVQVFRRSRNHLIGARRVTCRASMSLSLTLQVYLSLPLYLSERIKEDGAIHCVLVRVLNIGAETREQKGKNEDSSNSVVVNLRWKWLRSTFIDTQ